ncbi:MAG TPA: vitamin B12-dependent ribonucleotide reductase [Terriglobales bacterium]|nr:vitamin B12-dependent ribonucleotide reductase [Terriglobales bacterium]
MSEPAHSILNANAATTSERTGERETAPVPPRRARGLTFKRHFTTGRNSPYDDVQWERRSALIQNEKGETIFEQKDLEVPRDWSQTATNIVASKYLHGKRGSPARESSVRALVGRVAETMRDWGVADGYFKTDEDARIFHDELVHLLITQKAAFNSPVWFNCGVARLEPEARGANWYWDAEHNRPAYGAVGYTKPQCSACFINAVSDSLESILTLAKTEGMLFKWGSGTGTNLSPIRSSAEQLSGGGTASGPLSFMKGFDAFAGVIKSGGKTRRAAKMVVLNADHPDIEDFIWCKAKEERKAWTLVQAGYDASLDGDAYSSIFFQNANNSVRVNDTFMSAAEQDGPFELLRVAGERKGEAVRTVDAKGLLRMMAEAAWQCGDPGIQYDTIINRWHTSKNTARINASNPCSEYMFLDDSACNLASINLMKFPAPASAGGFDVAAYRQAVDILITAQEIIVDNASYPTERIAQNSHDYRPLGLGYANLGALLMSNGLPYDSDAGRDFAGTLTAIMCGQAYLQSARIAGALAEEGRGAFAGYAHNREPMLDVIRMHRAAVNHIHAQNVAEPLLAAAKQAWDDALEAGSRHGYRNAQVTVLAPTGTIGFMMDCDTTGIEPDLALVKYKKLVGGGVIKIVNQSVDKALLRMGYSAQQTHDVLAFIEATGTVEGAPHLKAEHLPVFDCSFKPANGTRSIHYLGHVRMMAAAQPFLSGAISKTVNLPEAATVDDIVQVYMEGWKLGLKAIAVYRDGSKKAQPMSTSGPGKEAPADAPAPIAVPANVPSSRPYRRRLPEERRSLTHKFKVGGHEGYITVGMYEDGQPGEIFVTMAKEGSAISGLMDSFATAISLALQHGVPLKLLVDKFSHTRFEPSGWSGNPQIGYAKSIMDYLFRWLGLKFLDHQPEAPKGVEDIHVRGEKQEALETVGQIPLLPSAPVTATAVDAPACHNCGSLMVPNGSCYKCVNCGETSGCS